MSDPSTAGPMVPGSKLGEYRDEPENFPGCFGDECLANIVDSDKDKPHVSKGKGSDLRSVWW